MGIDWQSGVLCGGLLLAGIAAYAGSFRGVFLFDDHRNILDNVRIQQWPPSSGMLRGTRPVTDLTFAINYRFGAENPWGYHLVNLVIHLMSTLVLFGVVRRTVFVLGWSAADPATTGQRARLLSFCAALLWLLHPLQTQSVTYVVQRAESMTGLFYLLTLYCVLRGAESGLTAWHARAYYCTAIVVAALGMGCKGVMVTAPVAVLMFDRTFLAGSFIAAARRRWPVYGGLAATWVVLVWSGVGRRLFEATADGRVGAGFGVVGIGWWDYLRTQPEVILHYLRLSLFPSGLCLDYAWPVENRPWMVVLPGAAVLTMLGLSVWGLIRRAWWGFAGFWIFLVLSPTSSFIPVKDLAFEHRMYLPLAGVVLLALGGGSWMLARTCRWAGLSAQGQQRAVYTGAMALIAVALGVATFQRNRVYQDVIQMWEDVAAKSPGNPRAVAGIGAGHYAKGDIQKSLNYFEKALEIDPQNVEARYNRGVALGNLGQSDAAVKSYEAVLQDAPNHYRAATNLGGELVKKGRLDDAIRAYELALTFEPQFALARYGLGRVLEGLGRFDEAAEQFQEVVRRDPHHARARYRLGIGFMRQGKHGDAIGHFQAALQAEPVFIDARKSLGLAQAQLGRGAEAIAAFREVVRQSPVDADAYFNLGVLLAQSGDTKAAGASFRACLAINPQHQQAKQGQAALAGK